MHLPQDFFGTDRAGSSGEEVKKDNSQKQGLLGAMMASSFDFELKRIQAGKTFGFGGSCLVAARKTSQVLGK